MLRPYLKIWECIQTEKAKFSHFDRTRGDKNQIFRTSAAPEGIGGPGKRPSGLSKTKTWCGPLDETMINLVGNKYVQACPGGRNEE